MKIIQETITARKNPTVMLASSLSEKKYRDKHRLFLAEGHKLCEEAVRAGAEVECVLLTEQYAKEHHGDVVKMFEGDRYADTRLLVLSEGCFEKISTEKSPEGIILLVKYLDISKRCIKIYVENSGSIGRAILLSSIRDPGNLGTVLRSAGAFGAETVILSDDCADVYHPRAVRAAMGAVFRVPTLRVSDTEASVAALCEGGRRVFAAELRERALPLSDIALRASDVIVIGNEGHGISESLSDACTGSVYLPIAKTAESLNAAAAATVFLWEQSKLR